MLPEMRGALETIKSEWLPLIAFRATSWRYGLGTPVMPRARSNQTGPDRTRPFMTSFDPIVSLALVDKLVSTSAIRAVTRADDSVHAIKLSEIVAIQDKVYAGVSRVETPRIL